MIRTAFLAVLALVALASNVEARPRHKSYLAHPDCNVTMPCEGVSSSPRGEMIARKLGFGGAQKIYKPRAAASQPRQRVAAASPAIVAHPPGCPSRAFCGCGAAVRVFGAPIRSLWLAANWFKFPKAAPAAGMVAVRRHHVFVLEQHLDGNTWLAFDANSGRHQTRIHARSIGGYVIVDPRGGAA